MAEDENMLSYLLVVVADDIVVVGVEVLLILLIFFFLFLYQLWMDTAADSSFRLDPIIDMDPEAEICRLDPLDVDALLGGLERLLDLPMRAGVSDRCRLCCSRNRRLLLVPSLLICNHKLYSLCLSPRVG